MVMNDFYVSRKNDDDIIKDRENEIKRLLNGQADDKKLYIFPDLPVSELYANKSNLHIYNLDGVYIGTTSKLEGESEVNANNGLDLIGMHTIYADKGSITGNNITLNSKGQTTGPYISLDSGSYHVTWKGDNLDDATAKVTSLDGKESIKVDNLKVSDKEVTFDFTLTKLSERVEFILVNSGEGDLLITGLNLSKNK